MKELEIKVETGWTTDDGRMIIIKTHGIDLDDAIDNAQLFAVDENYKEHFYMDVTEFHPDTIENMIWGTWMSAVEKELDNEDDQNVGEQ